MSERSSCTIFLEMRAVGKVVLAKEARWSFCAEELFHSREMNTGRYI
uniref:Uncharacterized protein n=1 Tax=Parascaris equorum TaxID=6256 RepID=A0A914S4J5_PAREQ